MNSFAVASVWREVKKETQTLNETCFDRESNGVGMGGIAGTIILVCPSYCDKSLH